MLPFAHARPAWLFASVLLALISLPGQAAEPPVESIEALQVRVAAAQPGDTIVMKTGRYETKGPITVACAGTAERPVTIRADSVGAVEIAGTHGFMVSAPAGHVVIAGFLLTHASGRSAIAAGTRHVRFTRNTFQCAGEGPYLTVSGDDAQVDRNEFRDKRTLGNMLSVTGVNGQVARRLWVHHNYFHDFANARGNGAETIRFGLSGLSMSLGHGLVEHNLFVRCVGENELISNKSGGNTYRYNTFLDSPGAQLTLRHGNECLVYGNHFRGTDGMRIFGDRHLVFSNHLEGNTLGINLGNGGAEVADGAPLTSHDRPDDCVIVFNTLVDNRTQYAMNARRPVALGATNTTFAHNIIVGGEVVARIDGPNPGAVWRGNIVWVAGELGAMPADAAIKADPLLAAGPDGFQRLRQGSPAIDGAAMAFPRVVFDIDGQPRVGPRDVGADEFSAAPAAARVLTPADVGPGSP